MNQIFTGTYNRLNELDQLEVQQLVAIIVDMREGGGDRAKCLHGLTQLMPETVRIGYTVDDLSCWLESLS
jgi:hypothetical protein